MGKTKYEIITEARNILGLPEKATMQQIINSYRELLKKWHPDKCKEDKDKCKEMSIKVIEAYRIIIDYCSNYEYSFTKEDVARSLSPEDWWYQRFGDDPLWGKGDG
ncbi:MAG: J domain-containing protein [Deltaproteobacteria bacterium]|nr:J domain-containing protein [Deltaproteobacteria bacterium]RLA91869.1 MAG: J domain-containing protein [Deltaproteobacteria bacterium]